MSVSDEILEEEYAKRFDFGFRTQRLFEAPIETMEEEDFDEFLAELQTVSERVNKCLRQARLKNLKSLPRWEKCGETLQHIAHRILANPVYLKLLSTGKFEESLDNLIKQFDS